MENDSICETNLHRKECHKEEFRNGSNDRTGNDVGPEASYASMQRASVHSHIIVIITAKRTSGDISRLHRLNS